MMHRKFKPAEKVVLLLLVIALLACLYLYLIDMPVKADLADAASRSDVANVGIQVESAKAAKKSEMIDLTAQAMDDPGWVPLSDYDNQTTVVAYLNSIMPQVIGYNLVFAQVQFSEYVAVRQISMSFTCDNYFVVRNIVNTLETCPYYCQVTGISMGSKGDSSNIREDMISASLTVVFYEYTGDQTAALAGSS